MLKFVWTQGVCMGYFNDDPSEYEYRAFDIETTGFGAHDTLTTFTLEDGGVYHIWVNTDEREFDAIEAEGNIQVEAGVRTKVHAAEDSEALLESVSEYIEENFTKDTVVVAYNGETRSGGFDLQFLRTACLRNNIDWIFNDVKYLDIYPIFGKHDRFQTNVPSHEGLKKSGMKEFADWMGVEWDSSMSKSEISNAIADTQYDFRKIREWVDETDREEVPTYNYNDQVGIYQALFDEVHEYDPWTDSANAVTAFHEGDFVPLALHNLADVVKTKELTDAAVDTVSSNDMRFKLL